MNIVPVLTILRNKLCILVKNFALTYIFRKLGELLICLLLVPTEKTDAKKHHVFKVSRIVVFDQVVFVHLPVTQQQQTMLLPDALRV